jgi:hypothetical protein
MWFQGPPARRIVPAGERGKPMNARCEKRLPLLNRVHDRLHYLARILGAVGLAQLVLQPAENDREGFRAPCAPGHVPMKLPVSFQSALPGARRHRMIPTGLPGLQPSRELPGGLPPGFVYIPPPARSTPSRQPRPRLSLRRRVAVHPKRHDHSRALGPFAQPISLRLRHLC